MQMYIDLYQGDCLEVMSNLRDGCIDMVLTDPPYGMGFQSNWSKSGPRHRKIEGDITVDTRFIPLCYDKLKEGGGIVVFCNWETSHIWRGALENCGFKVKSQVIWNRLHHGMGDLKGAFAPMHDIIWYASKGRRIFVNGRPKSVKEYKRASPGQDFGHPTVKPLGLIEELIKDTESADRGIILDPFMGSGTTGVACKNLGRDFIGIELDETYFRIAQERIKNNH